MPAKVMATRVTRYYVSPAQCTIPPHSSKIVSVFIPDPFPEPLPTEVESEAYDRAYQASCQAYIDGADKFMMVMVALDSEVDELAPSELAAVGTCGGGAGGARCSRSYGPASPTGREPAPQATPKPADPTTPRIYPDHH